MGGSRLRNAFSRRTILTVGRLLAFVAVGFGVGLVIGVATEEPELLAGHLRGDTETVELDAALASAPADADADPALADGRIGDAGGGALPDVAASPDVWGGNAEAVAVDATADAPAPLARPATRAAGDGWAIQVGAFGDAPSAEKLADRLERKGYPVEILPAGADSNRWRVRVQPIAEEQSARRTAERIEREERLPIWVIRLEGQTRS